MNLDPEWVVVVLGGAGSNDCVNVHSFSHSIHPSFKALAGTAPGAKDMQILASGVLDSSYPHSKPSSWEPSLSTRAGLEGLP